MVDDAELLARAEALVAAYAADGRTVATAESCTGGLVAGLLTAVPGSSAVVERGFVTYSNEAKAEAIGVPMDLIRRHGAVSEAVARAMAVGALAAGVAYCSLFLMLAVVTRNAVVIGLIYALIWETLVGGLVPGAQALSVQQWSLAVVEQVLGDSAVRLGVESAVGFGTGLVLPQDTLYEAHTRCFSLFAAVARMRPGEAGRVGSITKRELECLKLTANGCTSEDIARQLKLSVHTANQYLTQSAQKLNAVSRTQAVAKALRLGLIE